MVSEVFRRLPGEPSGDSRQSLPEVRRRPGRRPGGGQEEAREDSREAREDSREEAREDSREESREDSREDSREEPGGGPSVVNSSKSEGGGSLSGSPPQVLRNSPGGWGVNWDFSSNPMIWGGP